MPTHDAVRNPRACSGSINRNKLSPSALKSGGSVPKKAPLVRKNNA